MWKKSNQKLKHVQLMPGKNTRVLKAVEEIESELLMNLQTVDIGDESALCSVCKTPIMDMEFVYDNKAFDTPIAHDELCKCKKCGTQFILHFELFDPEGHILPRVFTEDINNLDYSWQDLLTEDQKEVVADHLEMCQECQSRLTAEILSNALFSNFLKRSRPK